MKPRWMRMHISCPECGRILKDENDPSITRVFVKSTPSKMASWKDVCFDCPQCKIHLSAKEFWQAHEDKIAHVVQYNDENHSTLIEE